MEKESKKEGDRKKEESKDKNRNKVNRTNERKKRPKQKSTECENTAEAGFDLKSVRGSNLWDTNFHYIEINNVENKRASMSHTDPSQWVVRTPVLVPDHLHRRRTVVRREHHDRILEHSSGPQRPHNSAH
jgi:hypothetical protein